jgi:hypothetical protein
MAPLKPHVGFKFHHIFSMVVILVLTTLHQEMFYVPLLQEMGILLHRIPPLPIFDQTIFRLLLQL